MPIAYGFAAAFLLTMLSGCAVGPHLSEHPPADVDTEHGRIYVYRLPALEGSALRPFVMLDGHKIGNAVTGGVLFVDVSPGEHMIEIQTDKEKVTLIQPVTVVAGGSSYVRLDVSPGVWTGNLQPVLVDQRIGAHDVKNLVRLN